MVKGGYDEGVFTGTLSGGTTTNPTGTIRYVKNGAMVVLYIPTLLAVSNAGNAPQISGLPAALIPARTQFLSVLVQDAGTGNVGYISIAPTTGIMTMNRAAATNNITGGFTASGSKGMSESTIAYMLT